MTVSDSGTPMVIGGDSMGFGGGGFIWAFLIFALLMGNGGFGFGGNNGNNNANAIQADVNRGFDNQNLQAQTRDILSAVTSGTAEQIAASSANAANAINAIKDGNASLIREFGNVETALTALSGKQQECCCNILRASDDVKYSDALNTAAINQNIAQSRYDAAMNTAAINATTTAQTQKILDALAQNKIESLQNKVNFLETQSLLGNVVRYPTATTYTAGGSPFCSGAYNGYPLYS